MLITVIRFLPISEGAGRFLNLYLEVHEAVADPALVRDRSELRTLFADGEPFLRHLLLASSRAVEEVPWSRRHVGHSSEPSNRKATLLGWLSCIPGRHVKRSPSIFYNTNMPDLDILEELAVDTNTGDHDRFAHYVDKSEITDAVVNGWPVIALCGKIWVPSRDPSRYPVCPICEEMYAGLFGQ